MGFKPIAINLFLSHSGLSLLTIFFLLSGILCILLGIVAEIQSRIYFQTTENKSYLIKNIIKFNKKKN